MSTENDTPTRRKNREPAEPAKRWLFRALALIGIPALLFLGLEGGLRLAGFGRPTGFLIPDEKPGYFRTNPDFVGFFLPRNFDLRPLNFRISARKPANTVRIVILGESAAQGVPAPAFAFAPQLRAQLRTRYPGRDFEVINTGIVAINSHVVRQIARDLADFSPDLFVVYLGNNEVVGPYGPGCAYLSAMPPLWVIRLSMAAKFSRTGQLLSGLLSKLPHPAQRPLEWGGMAMFVNNAVRGDDPRLEEVYRNFDANLRDIVDVATAAGAKTLLCTVVANLKDSAPFLSLHRPGLAEPELKAWQHVFDQGKVAWLLGETGAARRDLQEALRLDPQYADTAFMLGAIELQAGDAAAARRLLVDAAHWDALRFRPDPRLNAITRQIAREHGPAVSLVDAAVLLGSDQESTGSIAGRELLFEHVHFDWEGNHRLALLMAQGAEAALGHEQPGRGSWLDSSKAAAALAYTPYERLALLQHVADIVRNPPFNNQLTYYEDQARLAREIVRAETAFYSPGSRRQAKAVAEAAMAADPENPALAGLAEGIASELGDLPGAVARAQRMAELLPADLALQADQASLLAQQGKFPEAEKILRQAASLSADPDKLAPSLGALYSRVHRFAEGRAYLDRALAHHPAEPKLLVMRGNIARLAGEMDAAERDFRSALEADSGNQSTLEALVSLLAYLGRPAEVEQVSLAVAENQTRNQLNNLRVARIHETRGDEAQAVRFLQAAESSGPAAAAMEVSIAKKLHRLGRDGEALTYLAKAKRLSLEEGDAEVTASIDEVIARLRSGSP